MNETNKNCDSGKNISFIIFFFYKKITFFKIKTIILLLLNHLVLMAIIKIMKVNIRKINKIVHFLCNNKFYLIKRVVKKAMK